MRSICFETVLFCNHHHLPTAQHITSCDKQALVTTTFRLQLNCCIRRHYSAGGRWHKDSALRMAKIHVCSLLLEEVHSLGSSFGQQPPCPASHFTVALLASPKGAHGFRGFQPPPLHLCSSWSTHRSHPDLKKMHASEW